MTKQYIIVGLVIITLLIKCLLDKMDSDYLVNNCAIVSRTEPKVEYVHQLDWSFVRTPATTTYICPDGFQYIK